MDKEDSFSELYKNGITNFLRYNYVSSESIFRELIKLSPTYNNGMPYCYLACSLWVQGKKEEAKKAHLKALELDPKDLIRLGRYASFVAMEVSNEEAFNLYLRMLKISRDQGILYWETIAFYHLEDLGEKMDWSKEKVQKAIDEA